MNEATDTQPTIIAYATRLGDDSLVLGHRLSEWTRNGPFLEEDLALSNVALDYIGRARMYYSYAAELSGKGKTEDDFAYTRDQREFRNLLINEMPNGDFAFTMLRQLFVDVFNMGYLTELANSTDETLAAIAAKALKETRYHLRRSHEWVLRLGDGTDESHQRAQQAVDELWGYTPEFFDVDALEQSLADKGIGVDNAKLHDAWLARVSEILDEATLTVPESSWEVKGGRQGYHTENLGHLLNDLQFLHRAYPGLKW